MLRRSASSTCCCTNHLTLRMGGLGVAAAELLPAGMFSTNPNAKIEKADPQPALNQ
jgi:hypothetical protein